MSTSTISSVDAAVAQLTAAVAAVRAAASSGERVSAEVFAATLRLADELTAAAVGVLIDASLGVEAETGLSTELWIQLAARRCRWDARELTGAADLLRGMPHLADALASGGVSWPQVRALARDLRSLPAGERREVDERLPALTRELAADDSEHLVDAVRDLVLRLSVEREQKREQQAIEASFLVLQPRFDGSGSVYGEADPETFATLGNTLDAAAPRPVKASEDDPSAPSRAQQLMAGLRSVCESYLAGSDTSAGNPSGAEGRQRQAKPRFFVTMDAADEQSLAAGARLLGAIPGAPVRLTPTSTERLLCDAEVIPIVFKDGQPIGIGDTRKGVPAKIRAALIARDGGCRFPGCQAPVGWCDVHHLRERSQGGDHRITNLGLFCRPCHNRIHDHGWELQMLAGAVISFTRGRKRYRSHPRARPPNSR